MWPQSWSSLPDTMYYICICLLFVAPPDQNISSPGAGILSVSFRPRKVPGTQEKLKILIQQVNVHVIYLSLTGNAFARIISTNFRVFMAQYETFHLLSTFFNSFQIHSSGMAWNAISVGQGEEGSGLIPNAILFYTYQIGKKQGLKISSVSEDMD